MGRPVDGHSDPKGGNHSRAVASQGLQAETVVEVNSALRRTNGLKGQTANACGQGEKLTTL